MKQLSRLLFWLSQHFEKPVMQRTDTLVDVNTQTVVSRRRWIKYALLLLACCVLYRRCNHHISTVPGTIELNGGNRVELKNPSSENDSRTPTSTSRIPSRRSVPYTPVEGSITLEPVDPNVKDINDIIRIRRQVWGFTRELGIQTSFFQVSAGLDYKFFFVQRFGATVGVLGSNQFPLFVSPTVAVTYKLDRIPTVHNLSLWVGFVPLSKYQYQAGLRLPL